MEANNTKAMRDALEEIWKEANTQYWNDNGIDLTWLMAKAKSALSAPPRNCDVGTVEEQAQRFNDYCHKQGNSCCIGRSKGTCPMFRGYKVDCALVWSQTPYEKGAEK